MRILAARLLRTRKVCFNQIGFGRVRPGYEQGRMDGTMLYLTRKVGESVIINDDIRVTVVDIRGKSIKLGFTFPAEASVLREEIHQRIQEENRAAAASSDALAAALGGSGSDGETPEAPEEEAGSKRRVIGS